MHLHVFFSFANYASSCAIVATEEKKQQFNKNSGARRKLSSIPKLKVAFKRVPTV
jgi:hypothetical protein